MTTDELTDVFIDYAREDLEGAIQLMTGLFVGISESYVKSQGADYKKEIIIDGKGQRKITIHSELQGVNMTTGEKLDLILDRQSKILEMWQE